MCWLWSVSFPNYYVLYTSSWNCQMLSAEQLLPDQAARVALPNAHHGKNKTYWATILQLSWSGRQSRSTLQLSASYVCPPPLLQYRCTVHSHLCGTKNTWHPRGNIVKKDPKSFLLSSYLSYLVLPPRHHSWYSHNGSPFHSLLLIEQVHVCAYLPARGTGVDQIIWQQNKCGFSSLLLFHAYM